MAEHVWTSLSVSFLMAWAYVIGKILGDALHQVGRREQIGFVAGAGLLGSFTGTVLAVILDQITGTWNSHPLGDLKAAAIALFIAAETGVVMGWREPKKTSN